MNGVTWDHDVNIDAEGKPVLSLQKLHFVYDPLVVLFTPNDLTHKYALQPKQQVLALDERPDPGGHLLALGERPAAAATPPTNICAQQILPDGDRHGPAEHRLLVAQPAGRPRRSNADYLGMSVNSFLSVSGVTYNIEESALQNDQTGTSFISPCRRRRTW